MPMNMKMKYLSLIHIYEKFIASQPLDSISKNLAGVFSYDLDDLDEKSLLIKDEHAQSKYQLFIREVICEMAGLLKLRKRGNI